MSYIKTGKNLLSCKPKYLLFNKNVVSKNINPLKWNKNDAFWEPRPADMIFDNFYVIRPVELDHFFRKS